MSSLQGTTPIPLTESTTEPTGAVSSSTKQQLELHTTSGMKGSDKDTKERNVSAFYKVVWPILEKEGGWTLVKGTGAQEGLTIFCPPGSTNNTATITNSEMEELSTRILAQSSSKNKQRDNTADGSGGDDDDNNSHFTPKQQPLPSSSNHHPVLQLLHQQGPWNCICGTINDEGTSRCEACFGWREGSSVTVVATTTTTTTKPQQQRYYTKMKHVITHILKKESAAEQTAAEAYEREVPNAMELFGPSSSTTSSRTDENNNNNDEDDEINSHNDNNHNNYNDIPLSPNARMTRQRFSDIAWKENRTHYEKSCSRVGGEYQVDVLPVVGSYKDGNEEVLYDQVWDKEKAQKSGKIDFIDHRVKSSIKEPAYDMLHQREYRLPGFFADVISKAQPTDCSHWTAEERAKFRKLVFEKHEDMWQISKALGRPVRECVTYYLGKFKTSKDFRSLRRVMEKARDENPFKYPGEILCDKCGKGGKLVYCDSCDSHYHLTCQDPPLEEVPEGNDWKCNACVEKDNATSGGDDEGETDDKTEDSTSKSGVGVAEMDTSNAEDAEEEASSFGGKGSDMNDDTEMIPSANKQEKKGEVALAAEAEGANDINVAANDAIMSDSASASGAGGEKRPSSGDNNDVEDADTPQHQTKKVKSLTDSEAVGGTLTSGNGVGEMMSGLSEMAPPPPQQPPVTR